MYMQFNKVINLLADEYFKCFTVPSHKLWAIKTIFSNDEKKTKNLVRYFHPLVHESNMEKLA
jgi:cytoplasmic iron level regulating protein YaaA (DUF328/UPF0246 family)